MHTIKMSDQSTQIQYQQIISVCRDTFLKKAKDYGTSWRVYRTISIADQIFIKARRIRTIQEKKQQRIEDGIKSEFEGILNYAVIGLIQLSLGEQGPEELPTEMVAEKYDEQIIMARKLMGDKNHDYGEAWRDMSQESFVDLILVKLLRIKQILANDGKTLVSEGIASNFLDILNYAAFGLILIAEGKHGQ